MTWEDVEKFEAMVEQLEERARAVEPTLLELAVTALLKNAIRNFYDNIED